MFDVDNDAEIPKSRKGRPSIYPFTLMKVDDSFFIPKKKSHQMSPICDYWNKKLTPEYFIARHIDNDGVRIMKGGVKGCRVYRVR